MLSCGRVVYNPQQIRFYIYNDGYYIDMGYICLMIPHVGYIPVTG
nr:MAG TPA: hypothetical protein [Caudoviricetes sp.]